MTRLELIRVRGMYLQGGNMQNFTDILFATTDFMTYENKHVQNVFVVQSMQQLVFTNLSQLYVCCLKLNNLHV